MGTYKAGGEIATDIVFAQNHLGRVFMSVCPLNAKSESECKALQRCAQSLLLSAEVYCSCTADTSAESTGEDNLRPPGS